MKKISHKISVDAFNKAFAFYNSDSDARHQRGVIELCKLFALKNQHGALKPKQVKKIEFKLTNKDTLSFHLIKMPNQISFYQKTAETYQKIDNDSQEAGEYSFIPEGVEELSDLLKRKTIEVKLFFVDLVNDLAELPEDKDAQMVEEFDTMSLNDTFIGSTHSMSAFGGNDVMLENNQIIIKNLENEVANLRAEIEQKNNDLQNKDQLIIQRDNNVQNLQVQVTTQTNLYTNTNAQLQTMTQQYNTANLNYNTVNNQLTAKNSQINSLTTQLTQANSQKNTAQTQVAQANAQKQALQTQVTQLQGQNTNIMVDVFMQNGTWFNIKNNLIEVPHGRIVAVQGNFSIRNITSI